jgi:release factor glutamine methyltransferase
MLSILEVVRRTEAYLQRHGVESARVESEHLVSFALGLKRLDLYMQFDRPLNEAELAAMRPLLTRRARGEPLQYITGSTGFHDIELAVGPGALVPRPETERLVELALDRCDADAAVLDLCTGTGAIALAIAAKRPAAEVVGVDLSADALAWAARNREASVADQVSFLEGDLFAPVAGRTFDLITANPPYVSATEFGDLPPTVRDFEPHIALVAADNGLALIRRILKEAPAYLAAKAWLAMEIGETQGAATLAEAVAHGWDACEVALDYTGRDRVFLGRRGG